MKRSLFVAAALALAASPAAAEPREITLEEAIRLATDGNVQIAIAKEDVAAAEARVRSSKAMRLPTLGIGGTVLVWNEAIEAQFPTGDPAMPVATLVIREQVTATGEVNVAQPLSALIVIGKLVDLEQAGARASRADLDSKKLDVAFQAAEVYLQVLQLKALQQVAEASVGQLDANLARAQALKDAGILFDVDLLRLQAQRDAVIQQGLEAEVGAETARRGLALLLGLPDGTDLELAPIDVATIPQLPWSEDDAVALALKQRPDARVADARAEQAARGVDVARAEYFPNVLAIGNYTRNEGQGEFAIKDSAFVGVSLQWNLWDWGKRKADVQAARAQARQARIASDFVDDQVALDVRSKWLAAATQQKMLAVAESGLRAAEEAHRLQNVRFEQGAATTTDVIDAETEVARARTQATIARYQYLTAWMALVRAVGQMPELPRSR